MFRETPDVIEFFLRLQRATQIETRRFRHLKHNRDLCPVFQQQIERILESYGRFLPVVYDTQGLADDGVDVAVRYERERDPAETGAQIAGLQLESFDDCTSRTLLRELKAQRDDAFRKVVGLVRYFIVLCTDADSHQAVIRRVEAEFRSAERTYVIEPQYASYFMDLSESRIDGLVTRAMLAEDVVFRKALEMIEELPSRSAGVLLVWLAVQALQGRGECSVREILEDNSIKESYGAFAEALRKRLERMEEAGLLSVEADGQGDEEAEEWEAEEAIGLEMRSAEELLVSDLDSVEAMATDLAPDGRIRLRMEESMPLVALLADAQVRYDLPDQNLHAFALDALGLLDA